MTKVMHLQTIQSEEYGNLKCYGLICNQTDYYLSNMKNPIPLLYKHSPFISILSFFGKYLPKKTAPSLKGWEYFLCIHCSVLEEFLIAYNSGDFEEIAKFSVQYKEIAFIFPLIIKNYELIRSGKKNIFAIEFEVNQEKHYCIKIQKNVFKALLKQFRD